jgi:hypothetical protein
MPASSYFGCRVQVVPGVVVPITNGITSAADFGVGEDMPEFDDERRARWRMQEAPDGWRWWTPHWDRRVATDSPLALTVEALRRVVELRDAPAESGEDGGLTLRTLHLVSILNHLYDHLVAERAESLGLTMDPPHGYVADIVKELLEAGILTPDEYQPRDVAWPGV